jgi:hypothetical protein
MATRAAMKQRTASTRPADSKGRAKPQSTDARVWLRENGYADVADRVDSTIERWMQAGKSTRRNWWDTLAGGDDGRPYSIEGQPFPVLASAQLRQGKTVTPNAIKRGAKEKPPPVRQTGRWAAKRKT